MKKKKSLLNHLIVSFRIFINSLNFSSIVIKPVRPLSSTIIINPFERLRPLDIPNEQRSSEEVSLQIFDQPIKQNEIPPTSAPILRPIKSTIEQQFYNYMEVRSFSILF